MMEVLDPIRVNLMEVFKMDQSRLLEGNFGETDVFPRRPAVWAETNINLLVIFSYLYA